MEEKEGQEKPPLSREEMFKEIAVNSSSAIAVFKELLEEHFNTYTLADRARAGGFEERTKELMEGPNADGWLRLCEVLNEAKKDKRIASSTGASNFLSLMKELAADAFFSYTSKEALEPLEKAIKSSQNRENALKRWEKRAEAEEWVISEWKENSAAYQGNKSDFARIYARLVFNKFDVDIKERNIRERWLKGL